MEYEAGEDIQEGDAVYIEDRKVYRQKKHPRRRGGVEPEESTFSYELDLHPNYWLHVDECGMKIFERRFFLPSPEEPIMASDFVLQKGDGVEYDFRNDSSFYLAVHRKGEIVFEWRSDDAK